MIIEFEKQGMMPRRKFKDIFLQINCYLSFKPIFCSHIFICEQKKGANNEKKAKKSNYLYFPITFFFWGGGEFL